MIYNKRIYLELSVITTRERRNLGKKQTKSPSLTKARFQLAPSEEERHLKPQPTLTDRSSRLWSSLDIRVPRSVVFLKQTSFRKPGFYTPLKMDVLVLFENRCLESLCISSTYGCLPSCKAQIRGENNVCTWMKTKCLITR